MVGVKSLHRVALLSLAILSLAAVCDEAPNFPPFAPAAVAGSPVRAEFIDLGSITVSATGPCDVALLAVAEGQSTEPLLHSGEVALQQGPGAIRAFGNAHALAVLYSTERCAPPSVPSSHVFTAPQVPWYGDRDDRLEANVPSSLVRLERLAGSAGIPSHRHTKLREVLCITEGGGTLTVAEAAHHLSGRECLQIPPSTEHARTPDPGSTPKAFRLLVPAGADPTI
jgi:hypothetical protein